ncbi:GyrI-like domain-containing protein [Nocardia vaccinii]|uniref:GyrI-like domain-containing protein n=1 Tax=Nocardia vaccinii TaxID=1822 RepID=UPI000A0320D2|nr:GyrI-like domain-containing protein [Nocardia vaccinii]
MEYRVNVCESTPQTMLRLSWELHRDQIGADIAAGMRELTATTDRVGLTACGAPTITYRKDTEPDGNIEVDFGVPVDLGTTLGPWSGAEVVAEPGSLVARTCHRGGYDHLDTAYRALDEWIRECGYRPAGPPTEVYLVGPEETSDPRRLITEIRIPVVRPAVIGVHVDRSFEETVGLTRQALTGLGFEIVSETDLRALLRDRVGTHIADHLALHAYHPPLTARALAADPQAAWLSSTLVIVRADDVGTLVEAGDPTALPSAFRGIALSEIADELHRLLTEALGMVHMPGTVR